MFAHTDIKQAPWYVVNADNKRRARLNCISHLLDQIPYEDVPWEDIELPERQSGVGVCPASDHRPDLRRGPLLKSPNSSGKGSGRARRSRPPVDGHCVHPTCLIRTDIPVRLSG